MAVTRTDWRQLAESHGWDESTAFCYPDSPAWLAGYRDGYRGKKAAWLPWRYKEDRKGATRYMFGHDAGSEDGERDRE